VSENKERRIGSKPGGGVTVGFDQITPPEYQSTGRDLETRSWERGCSDRLPSSVRRSSEVDTSTDPKGSNETRRRRGKPPHKSGGGNIRDSRSRGCCTEDSHWSG